MEAASADDHNGGCPTAGADRRDAPFVWRVRQGEYCTRGAKSLCYVRAWPAHPIPPRLATNCIPPPGPLMLDRTRLNPPPSPCVAPYDRVHRLPIGKPGARPSTRLGRSYWPHKPGGRSAGASRAGAWAHHIARLLRCTSSSALTPPGISRAASTPTAAAEFGPSTSPLSAATALTASAQARAAL